MTTQVGSTEQRVERVLHMHPGDLQHPAEPLQRAFDAVTAFSASPWIILGYLAFTGLYVVLNHFWLKFDNTLQLYTFAVSVLAIFLAQVILNSQGRQAEIESRMAANAYGQVQEIDDLQKTQLELLREVHTISRRLDAMTRKEPA